MTATLWIGLGFLILLVVFLVITFFIKDKTTDSQYNTLRFLTALCVSFAGGFISGDALFKLDSDLMEGTKMAISGTAGCALFFTVWFTYPKRNAMQLKDSFNFSIPDGWTFECAIKRIVTASQGVCEINGFSDSQLSLVLESREIRTNSAEKAIERLKYLNKKLPKYKVTVNEDIYTIEII